MSEAPALLRVTARAPQPGDVRALEAAERACFSDPWPSHLLLAEIFAPGRFHRILVEPAGSLVAYLLCAWQYLDLHVLKVATLPSYRRTGLARKLMILAEEHAQASAGESVTLEVRESNVEAIALYQTLGYTRTGRRPGYYGDGEDALVMAKQVVAPGEP